MNKLFIILTICFFPVWASADVVTLKTGQVVEGRITQRDDEKVVIEFEGVPLTYYLDEVASIVGVPQPETEQKYNALTVKPDKIIGVNDGEERTEEAEAVTDYEAAIAEEDAIEEDMAEKTVQAAEIPFVVEEVPGETYDGRDFMDDMGLKYVDEIETLGAQERERGENMFKRLYQQLDEGQPGGAAPTSGDEQEEMVEKDAAVDQALDEAQQLTVPAHVRTMEKFMKIQPE